MNNDPGHIPAIANLHFEEENGFAYADCAGLAREFAAEAVRKAGGALKDVEFELIRVGSAGLRPHYHDNSDSVAIVSATSKGVVGVYEFLVTNGGRSYWWTFEPGQVILLPRGLVHGFRQRDDVTPQAPLSLLVASAPPIADGDTHYVDV